MGVETRLSRAALLLAGVLLIALALGVSFGATTLSWDEIARGDETARSILLRIRLPRVIVAALVGAALAIAGATFQSLLRNPLADPFILGVSGGAACGAALATAFGLAQTFPAAIPIVAFAGAGLSTAAVFALARRRGRTDPARLLLSGLVLNAFFSAIILISFSLSRQSDLTAALRWMMGSLFAASWSEAAILAALFVPVFAVLVWYAGDLRMLTFGEEDARSRGVEVEKVKLAGFACASIITGAAVAMSGIIGFVGLLVPHLIRLAWRRDFRFTLPLSALGGAILLVLADLLSRAIVANTDLPIGAFTAILGVPFFISLLRRAA